MLYVKQCVKPKLLVKKEKVPISSEMFYKLTFNHFKNAYTLTLKIFKIFHSKHLLVPR